MMTPNQTFFNDAYLGLKSQGFRQSFDATGACAYRGRNGLKCAIGHCVPDEDYDPSFEGAGFVSSPALQTLLGRLYPGMAHHLADALQGAHDDSYIPGAMKAAILSVADEFELEVPE